MDGSVDLQISGIMDGNVNHNITPAWWTVALTSRAPAWLVAALTSRALAWRTWWKAALTIRDPAWCMVALTYRVRGSVPGLGGLKETKMFLPHPRVKVSIVGSLRDREVACSASDRQGSNFESCVWRTASSQSSHHPQEVLLAQFSLYVHKGGLKPDSFHFRPDGRQG